MVEAEVVTDKELLKKQDFLSSFGVVDKESVSKLNDILLKIESYNALLEDILKRLKEKVDNDEVVDVKIVKLINETMAQLRPLIELYGRYTGDLKNQSINLSVNLDYKDALMAHISLFNEISDKSTKEKYLNLAKEKGLISYRKME